MFSLHLSFFFFDCLRTQVQQN